MASYYRRLPPLVAQTMSDSCWAASLESWTRVMSGRAPQRQQDLIDAYANADNGGLDPTTGIPPLADDIGLSYEVVVGSDVTDEYLADKLRSSGHLILVYNTGGGFSHAVVVYGVGRPSGGALNASVMNPEHGGRYLNVPLTTLHAVDYILVMWSAW